MGAVPCSVCVAEGVDCPLMIDGECLHSTRHADSDRPSAAMRWWVDTGPLDPLTSAFAPGRRF